MRRGLLATVLLVLLAGCGDEEGPLAPSFERRTVLAGIAESVFVPAHEEFARRCDALESAVRGWADAPSPESLETARRAWRDARRLVKTIEAFDFGPAEDRRLGPLLDFWPVRPDSVEAAIGASSVEHLGASARGLPALEHLLFGPGSEEAPGPRRAHAGILAADLAATARTLAEAWRPYGQELASAGAGSEIFPTVQSALDKVIYRLVYLLRTMTDRKLGRPMGLRTGGEPRPAEVESRSSDASIDDLVANVDGIESVYRARFGERDGVGLDELVRFLDPALDEAIGEALARARADLEAIEIPLAVAVVAEEEAVERAFRSVKDLQRLVAVDLTGKIGVSFTFTDNDGD